MIHDPLDIKGWPSSLFQTNILNTVLHLKKNVVELERYRE